MKVDYKGYTIRYKENTNKWLIGGDSFNSLSEAKKSVHTNLLIRLLDEIANGNKDYLLNKDKYYLVTYIADWGNAFKTFTGKNIFSDLAKNGFIFNESKLYEIDVDIYKEVYLGCDRQNIFKTVEELPCISFDSIWKDRKNG